jgi:hypothetical protein
MNSCRSILADYPAVMELKVWRAGKTAVDDLHPQDGPAQGVQFRPPPSASSAAAAPLFESIQQLRDAISDPAVFQLFA